jgi:hypothetical protein
MQAENCSLPVSTGGSIMKTVICVAIAVAVLAATALAQTPTAAMPAKHSEIAGESTYEGRIEGDTIEECWTIPSLPFTETGNTCGFADDYEEMCPYGSNSTDVVYSYSPPYDMCVSISLCDSYYDTKVFVYEDQCTPGVPYACDDDNFACVDIRRPHLLHSGGWIRRAMRRLRACDRRDRVLRSVRRHLRRHPRGRADLL